MIPLKKIKMLHGLYLNHMLQFLWFYIIFMLCHLSEMGNPSNQQVCVECFNQLVNEGRKKTENICPQLRCDIITYSLAVHPSESFGLINYRHPSFFVHYLLCPSLQKHWVPCSNPWLLSSLTHFINLSWYLNIQGRAVAYWLRHYATNRQVAGSIPDGVIGIFQWHNPSGSTIALGLTQPLTEMSTRCISWG